MYGTSQAKRLGSMQFTLLRLKKRKRIPSLTTSIKLTSCIRATAISNRLIHYKLEYQTVNCLDTSGEVFAILLNAIYLAPLTLVRFES